MSEQKLRLRAVQVPWQISASVPYLRVHQLPRGIPEAVTFIGRFQVPEADGRRLAGGGLQIVEEPPDFEAADDSVQAAFRMVKVSLQGGHEYRIADAVSDKEVIRYSDYDMSMIPAIWKKPEPIELYIPRVEAMWKSSGVCPNPRMYEVDGSRWAADADHPGALHLLLLGHDEYIEILADAWTWEAGQPVP